MYTHTLQRQSPDGNQNGERKFWYHVSWHRGKEDRGGIRFMFRKESRVFTVKERATAFTGKLDTSQKQHRTCLPPFEALRTCNKLWGSLLNCNSVQRRAENIPPRRCWFRERCGKSWSKGLLSPAATLADMYRDFNAGREHNLRFVCFRSRPLRKKSWRCEKRWSRFVALW